MKILVCGDREWSNYDLIRTMLVYYDAHNKINEVIHGGCSGADAMAEKAAINLGVPTKVFKADWNKYGLAAGPIRNNLMLDEKPDMVLVFHNKLIFSKGSRHCANEAKRRNIPVYLITENEKTPQQL